MHSCFLNYEVEKALQILDDFAINAYDSKDNYERLSRLEILSKRLNVEVSQLAIKWVFTRNLNVFAIISLSSNKHILSTRQAYDIELSKKQSDFLNLECDEF